MCGSAHNLTSPCRWKSALLTALLSASAEFQDPYGIVVLLQNDLVVVDLTSPGYPCFENPYPMDLHGSPVTSCTYLADCPGDLVPALYSVGTAKQNRSVQTAGSAGLGVGRRTVREMCLNCSVAV